MEEKSGNRALAEMRQSIGKPMANSPSPFANWLAGILEVAEEGAITIRFTVRPEWGNPIGILHGGVIAAIMDDVIGATVHSLDDDFFHSTVNLTTDFLSVAKVGEEVVAKGNIVRQGRNILHGECYLYNTEGKLLAKGASNLYRTTHRKPGRQPRL